MPLVVEPRVCGTCRECGTLEVPHCHGCGTSLERAQDERIRRLREECDHYSEEVGQLRAEVARLAKVPHQDNEFVEIAYAELLEALGFEQDACTDDVLGTIRVLLDTAAEVEELRETNAMACEQPDPKCTCSGCRYADEVNNTNEIEQHLAEACIHDYHCAKCGKETAR